MHLRDFRLRPSLMALVCAAAILAAPASVWSLALHSDGTPCALVENDPMRSPPIALTSEELRQPLGGGQGPVEPFSIVINAGAGLSGNPQVLAAFERAAEQWEALFSDPGVRVTIDADLVDLGEDNADVLGSTLLTLFSGDHDELRQLMIDDGATEGDDGILQSLPLAAQFLPTIPDLSSGVDFRLTGRLAATKPNFKALGLTHLDGLYGATDATISFNSRYDFDYDNSDGVTAGLLDFESIAVHEIGHALGYFSIVDTIDTAILQAGGATGPPAVPQVSLTPRTLDLFRFRSDSEDNPSTPAEFASFPRNLVPGVAVNFDEPGVLEVAMSTGTYLGDGRQAGHWKDDRLGGAQLGIMDPSIRRATISTISFADQRAFDLIGYDILIGPTTTTTSTTSTTSTTTSTLPPTTTSLVASTTTLSVCSGACGDPDNDGKVLAGDALFALRAGVGLIPCSLCQCDVDNSGGVFAADALAILRFAVNIATATLNCPEF